MIQDTREITYCSYRNTIKHDEFIVRQYETKVKKNKCFDYIIGDKRYKTWVNLRADVVAAREEAGIKSNIYVKIKITKKLYEMLLSSDLQIRKLAFITVKNMVNEKNSNKES